MTTTSHTPPAARRRRAARSAVTSLLPRPLRAVLVALLLAFVLAPVAYVVLASVNSDLAVARGSVLPDRIDLVNYRRIWSTVGLGRGLANSLLVAGSVAIACAAVAICSAYVLVRHAFRGRLTILLGLQSVPGTRWALFVTYLSFALPFSTWVMVTYLRGLPARCSRRRG